MSRVADDGRTREQGDPREVPNEAASAAALACVFCKREPPPPGVITDDLSVSVCYECIDMFATRSGWQPIETAPKDGTRIFVYEPDGAFKGRSRRKATTTIAYWHQPGNPAKPGYWCAWSAYVHRPTHWMPLPAPPIAKDGRAPVAPSADAAGTAGEQS